MKWMSKKYANIFQNKLWYLNWKRKHYVWHVTKVDIVSKTIITEQKINLKLQKKILRNWKKLMFHLRLGPQSLGVYLKSRKINIILEFIVAANRLLELLSDDRKCTMSLKKIMAEFISRCLVKVISFLSRGRWGTYGQHFSIFNIVQNWNVFKSWPEMWHIFLKLLFVVY
jgi:hypothetical protein